jgi:hypothetical protein
MEELTVEQVQEARELIFPEAMVTMTAEDYERKVICAEHQRSLGDRLERLTWEAYAKRHGISGPQAEVMAPVKRGFG